MIHSINTKLCSVTNKRKDNQSGIAQWLVLLLHDQNIRGCNPGLDRLARKDDFYETIISMAVSTCAWARSGCKRQMH